MGWTTKDSTNAKTTMRKRKIIKRGENSYAIALMKSDVEDFGLIEGDVVDIDDLGMLEQEKPKEKKK